MEDWVEFTQAYDAKGNLERGGRVQLPVQAIRWIAEKGSLTAVYYSFDGATMEKYTVDQKYDEVIVRMNNAYERLRAFLDQHSEKE